MEKQLIVQMPKRVFIGGKLVLANTPFSIDEAHLPSIKANGGWVLDVEEANNGTVKLVDLETLEIADLRKVADYFGIEIKANWGKPKTLEAIREKMETEDVEFDIEEILNDEPNVDGVDGENVDDNGNEGEPEGETEGEEIVEDENGEDNEDRELA